MKIVYINKDITDLEESVCCIGYFDALHKGHQALISEAIKRADILNCKSGLICFNPDPVEVITGRKQPHVASFEKRIQLMESFGLDIVYIINFDSEFMKCMPEDFINSYLNRMNLKALVCGFDYSFGYKGLGKSQMLKELGNFDVFVVDEYRFYNLKISSTRLRKTILKGNFRLVDRLLGWDYYLDILCDKVAEIDGKWLIEGHVVDSDLIVPAKYVSNKVMIDDNKVFYVSDRKADVDDIISIKMYE